MSVIFLHHLHDINNFLNLYTNIKMNIIQNYFGQLSPINLVILFFFVFFYHNKNLMLQWLILISTEINLFHFLLNWTTLQSLHREKEQLFILS